MKKASAHHDGARIGAAAGLAGHGEGVREAVHDGGAPRRGLDPRALPALLGARADATTNSAASGYWVSMAKAKAKQPAKQASAAGGVPKKSHKKKPSSELIAPKPKPKRSEGNSAAAHVESALAQILDSQPSEHALGHPRRRLAWPNRPFGAFWVWFHGHVFRNQAATATTSATSCDRSCSGRRGSSTGSASK